ncbi:MAG: family metallophosphoesterase [Frankiales bacterium]|nr:family metallophosphoesterase [Frankiales bacterium]
MEISRRDAIKGAAVVGLAAFPARQAAAAGPVAPAHTTLSSTIVREPAGAKGYAQLVSGPGEPHVVRQDLGVRAQAGRSTRRTALLAFAQLTDIHVVDAQSPARVEFADRYNDGPGSPLIFGAAYRPHEMLTTQVADRIVAAVEQVGRGPAVGGRLAFVICTGDNADNCQHNEVRWQIDVLDGKTVRADSGDLTRWEGVHDQDALSYDVHYWHPDGAPDGKAEDEVRGTYGFPVVKGLLDAARRPYAAHGLNRPWYTCYGNHDGLVQGNFPQSFQLSALATGPLKITSLPVGVSPQDLAAGDPTVLAKLATGPARLVTADPNRKIVTRTETIREHFTTGGTPLGHGYTSENLRSGTAYYSFDPTPLVRCVVLDTVNPNGYSDGSLDQAQLSWLTALLQRSSRKLVLVFSHHTIATMTNPIVSVDDPGVRVLGDAVRTLLLAHPQVVAWVNGHTHVNRITAHPRAGGGGGFWEVNTASHIDWPSQARLLELVDNHDGTLSLFGTVIDAAAPLSYGGRLTSSSQLASLARELAANDPQEQTSARRGKVEDRNVELLIRAPFSLSAPAPVPAAPEHGRTGNRVPATGLGEGGALLAAGALGAALALRRRGISTDS